MHATQDTGCFTLSIGGLAILLHARQPATLQIMERRYHGFSAPGCEPSMTCHLDWEPQNDLQPSSAPEIAFTAEGLEFSSAAATGKINLHARTASLNCVTVQLEGAVEYFIRLVYALLAFEAGGLMLHGAGVLCKGLAAVFFGHSGSGKTTVSRLSGESAVLNDDLLLLQPSPDGWLVAATPFWNPTQVRPSPKTAPLGGLFRLVQDRQVFLQPASPAAALAELVTSIPVINADPQRIPRILERLSAINAAFPVQFLHFLPDDSFWEVVEPFLFGRRSGLNSSSCR